MANKTHKELMELLNTVPGVKEHLNSHAVIMGKQILKRRLELGLTQEMLVTKIRENGGTVIQPTLSKIEAGIANPKSETYDQILGALGGIEDITPKFKERPKSRALAPV